MDQSHREIGIIRIGNIYLEMQHYSVITMQVMVRIEMEVDKSYSEEFDWEEDH